MELNEYQEKAMTTCMETSNNWSYMFLNLVGEVGESASKVAKSIRKGRAEIGGDERSKNQLSHIEFPTCIEELEELKKRGWRYFMAVKWCLYSDGMEVRGCCSNES